MLPEDWPPEEPDDGIPDEDDPELEPPLDGMLEELPPELPEPPELPGLPDEGEDVGDGMLDDEDCCSAQPPMRKALTALKAVSRPAKTSSRLVERMYIVTPSVPRRHRLSAALARLCDSAAERSLSGQLVFDPAMRVRFNRHYRRTAD